MPVVTMREMIDAGVHFGHQTHRWNPRMKRYIFTERNGTYIIDLQQTVGKVDEAYNFIKETVARGGNILFVGTKRQAQEAIAEQATRVGMPYVNHRWLGGMLTNFSTVAKRVGRLKELEQIDYDNVAGSGYTKKELLLLKREKDKLEKSLGGIRSMHKVPSMLWVVDTNKEHLAVDEAKKLHIPVVAILDTNCNPEDVSYAVPGNDDAIRSVSLLTRVIAEAVAEGLIARDAKDGPVAEEPMAEWERELLKSPSKVSAQNKLTGEKKAADGEKTAAGKEKIGGDEKKVNSYSAADIKVLREKTGAGMLDVKKALEAAEGNVEKAIEALRIKGLKGAIKREGNATAEGLVEASVNGSIGVMVEINSETDFVAKSELFIEFAAAVKDAAANAGVSNVDEIMDVEVSGTPISEQLVETTARLGEKINIRRVVRVEGAAVEAYLHRTSKDLPPQVGVLVAVDSTDDKAKEAAHDVAVHIAAMSPRYATREDVPPQLVDDERRIARETAIAEGKPEGAIEKIVEGRLGGFFKENVLLEQPFAKDPKRTIAQVFKTADTNLVGFARFKVGTE